MKQPSAPPRRQSVRQRALFGTAVLALVFFYGATTIYDDFSNTVLCTLCLPFENPDTGRTRFLSCSNLEQRADPANSRNLRDENEAGTDWQRFAPASPEAPAVLRITVKKDRDAVVFYPRVEGADSSVTVYAEDGPYRRRLFALQGKDGQWTEMGRQYSLDLRCAPYGWIRKDVEVNLIVVLTGKWSQVWHLGSAVLF